MERKQEQRCKPDGMDKVKTWLQDSQNIRTTLAWAIRIAVLLMLLRLTFWSNKVIRYEYLDENPQRDSIIMLRERIYQLEKQDSIHLYERDKALARIDSLNIDELEREIAKRIRQR